MKKKVYKIFRCSKCRTILELELIGEEYIGDCKTCNRKIRTKK